MNKSEAFRKGKHLTQYIKTEPISKEDLIQEKIDLQKEIDSIAVRLGLMYAYFEKHRKYEDPEALARLVHAKRRRGRRMQEIQLKISEMNKQAKEGRSRGFKDNFIDVCRQDLMPETFKAIFDKASLLTGEGRG